MLDIVNWILTRKCDMRCSYCNIIKNSTKYNSCLEKEISYDNICNMLLRLKKYNSDCFNIFYGGEPTLWKKLPELISFCNKNKINYTVVTNMSERSYSKIKEILQENVINSLSFTIDPIIFDENANKQDDRYIKSKRAFGLIEEFRENKKVKELVAEVVADNNNIRLIHKLVEELTKRKVWTDFTVIEVPLNEYYDFASVQDYDLTVKPTTENINVITKLYEKAEKGEFMMIGHKALPVLASILPQHYICNLNKNLSVITIDSDEHLRLCYRIKGTNAQTIHMFDLVLESGLVQTDKLTYIKEAFSKDKKFYCFGCAWTCSMFGDLITSYNMDYKTITHQDYI